jgi:hypothetical protein
MMMMMFTSIELHNKNNPLDVQYGPARNRHKYKKQTNNTIDATYKKRKKSIPFFASFAAFFCKAFTAFCFLFASAFNR